MIIIVNKALTPETVSSLLAEYAASDEQINAVSLDAALRISPIGVNKVIASASLPKVTLDRLRQIYGDIVETV